MGKLPYPQAVKKTAKISPKFGMDIFQASSMLALLYDKPKEKTLKDLMDERKKMLKLE